jgi:hypothetical protein
MTIENKRIKDRKSKRQEDIHEKGKWSVKIRNQLKQHTYHRDKK